MHINRLFVSRLSNYKENGLCSYQELLDNQKIRTASRNNSKLALKNENFMKYSSLKNLRLEEILKNKRLLLIDDSAFKQRRLLPKSKLEPIYHTERKRKPETLRTKMKSELQVEKGLAQLEI